MVQDRYAASGKKLKMGKSCIYFKSADDLPLDLIGKMAKEEYIAHYQDVRGSYRPKRRQAQINSTTNRVI